MTAYNPPIRHASAIRHIVQSIADMASRIVDAVSNAYRRRKLMRELEALDDRMLRDIGLHRTELGSVVAELMGDAPSTRRHVMQSKSGRVPK